MRAMSDSSAMAIFGIVVFSVTFIDSIFDGDITDGVSLLDYYLTCGLIAGMSMWIFWFATNLSREIHGKDKDNQ